jgi:hypothetical protein
MIKHLIIRDNKIINKENPPKAVKYIPLAFIPL